MALADTGPAPYAPLSGIKTVITQHRERGLALPINAAYLQRLGIEESLARRTLAALKQLDLITEEGDATETLKKIKVAPTTDLQGVLADWVRSAYKPIFQYADLSDTQRVADQFRHYEPSGMRNRMVSLFFGLCAEAGLIEKVPSAPRRLKATSPHGTGPGKAKVAEKDTKRGGGTPPPPPPPPPPDQSATTARDRYVDFLLEKARADDGADPALLDRIERALGISGGSS